MPRPKASAEELADQKRRKQKRDTERRRGWKLTEDEYQESIVEAHSIIEKLVRLIGGAQRLPSQVGFDLTVWIESDAVNVTLNPSKEVAVAK